MTVMVPVGFAGRPQAMLFKVTAATDWQASIPVATHDTGQPSTVVVVEHAAKAAASPMAPSNARR
jgi:hypothetical protein